MRIGFIKLRFVCLLNSGVEDEALFFEEAGEIVAKAHAVVGGGGVVPLYRK